MDEPVAPDATGVDLLASLRRRGLISAEAYAGHLAARGVSAAPAIETGATALRPHSTWGLQLFALSMALIGGVFGVIGAAVQELQAGQGIFAPFVAAPVIEEALKPAGIYLLLLRWPHALLGRLHTAILCAISGLCFGLIESYVYVTWYYPEGDADYVLFRFTVPVLMHAAASFLVGYGLTRGVIDWAAGRGSLPKFTRYFYFAAVALHAFYNTTVVVLDLAGVLEF